MSTPVRLEVTGRIARVFLDRPERRNALSLETVSQLHTVLSGLHQRSDVGVVVVAGTGPVFCAGHDLSEMTGDSEAEFRRLFASCSQMMLTLRALPQPVIARVQGPATAAGCQLVAACDLAVASQDAWFATPGVKIGLFCSTPMVPLTRAIPSKPAMEMLLTGEPISAERAVTLGLINRAVPEQKLDAEVDRLATAILSYSSAVIGLGKAAFYRQLELDEDAAYDFATETISSNATWPDAREGISAFLEKRTPNWPSAQ